MEIRVQKVEFEIQLIVNCRCRDAAKRRGAMPRLWQRNRISVADYFCYTSTLDLKLAPIPAFVFDVRERT